MKMRDVEMEFETLSGGKVQASTNAAIAAAIQNIEDEGDLKGPRKITVTLTITPRLGNSGHVDTEAKVETKFPVQSLTGIGWISGGVAMTQREIVDKSGQIDWTRNPEVNDPDNIRREKHAMELRRAEAEDRRAEANAPFGNEVDRFKRQAAAASAQGIGISVEFGGKRHDLNDAARKQSAERQAAADDEGAEPDTFEPGDDDGGVLEATIAATEGRRKPKPQGAPRRKGE